MHSEIIFCNTESKSLVNYRKSNHFTVPGCLITQPHFEIDERQLVGTDLEFIIRPKNARYPVVAFSSDIFGKFLWNSTPIKT